MEQSTSNHGKALTDLGMDSKAWPFIEAQNLLKRLQKVNFSKDYVVFETGYGPSGLPHIGTFGEVARTVMVQRAFELISDIPTKLICFSDDLDGLRKVPTNVPNAEMLYQDLDLPLSKVRDPFGVASSFAEYNNSKLCEFLDSFNFTYQFLSSTECYKSGKFDEALLIILDRYDKIMDIMLPSLGDERKKTYSPFLPISPKTGQVLQTEIIELNTKKGSIIYVEPDGEKIEIPVTGGNVKLQWKPDWAMRWWALGVDYEMHGKDLIPSADLAQKVCKVIGSNGPSLFHYELFLDEEGQKISKSKGNGLAIEDWLKYAGPESLSFFMYQKPKTAKRLHFDVIPRAVDEYFQHLKTFSSQTNSDQLSNPIWHIHGQNPPNDGMPFSFTMLLNLVSASNSSSEDQLWSFIQKYNPKLSSNENPSLSLAVKFAVKYFKDFVEPKKKFREPDDKEKKALVDLASRLGLFSGDPDPSELQKIIFAVGRDHEFEPLRDWFTALYETLLGSSEGPRFGGFTALYGIDKTINLINSCLAGDLLKKEIN
ncbi:MAG: lysine--tRNA ligase [Rhodobacteraceae bacterium]|nr:MAG: lysine--tRNA ligase [Paracoccaceae bacterium]